MISKEIVKENKKWFFIIGVFFTIFLFGMFHAIGMVGHYFLPSGSLLDAGTTSALPLDILLGVGIVGILLSIWGITHSEDNGILILGTYMIIGGFFGYIGLAILITLVSNIVNWLSNPIIAVIMLFVIIAVLYNRGVFGWIDSKTKVGKKSKG